MRRRLTLTLAALAALAALVRHERGSSRPGREEAAQRLRRSRLRHRDEQANSRPWAVSDHDQRPVRDPQLPPDGPGREQEDERLRDGHDHLEPDASSGHLQVRVRSARGQHEGNAQGHLAQSSSAGAGPADAGPASPRPRSGERRCLDLAVADAPGGELAGRERQDDVRPAFPEADVLDVGARRPRGAREMGVEDRELVAVVLEEPRLGIGVELEAVRARGGVPRGDVALRDAVAERDQAAALVGALRAARARRAPRAPPVGSATSPPTAGRRVTTRRGRPSTARPRREAASRTRPRGTSSRRRRAP